jgi:hypothetical protein
VTLPSVKTTYTERRSGKSVITPAAWRITARQWLVQNGLIKIQKAGKVLPNFERKADHN